MSEDTIPAWYIFAFSLGDHPVLAWIRIIKPKKMCFKAKLLAENGKNNLTFYVNGVLIFAYCVTYAVSNSL